MTVVQLDLLTTAEEIARRWPACPPIRDCTCDHNPVGDHDYSGCAVHGCGCRGRRVDCSCPVCRAHTALHWVARFSEQIEPAYRVCQAAARPGSGVGSAGTEEHRRSKGTHSDPTLAAVLAVAPAHTPNSRQAADAILRTDARRRNAARYLTAAMELDDPKERLTLILEAQSSLSKALDDLKRSLPQENPLPKPKPGCHSCARIQDSQGRPMFSETRSPGSTLCRWCEDHLRPGRKWPPLEILEDRRDGKRSNSARWAEAEAAEKARARAEKKKRAS